MSILPTETARLRIKRMEAALIRSHLARPDVLPAADYELLRYALVLARLERFLPGAAGPQGRKDAGRQEVELHG